RSGTPSPSQITTAGTMPETASAATSVLAVPVSTRRRPMTSHVAAHHSAGSASAQPARSLKRATSREVLATMPCSGLTRVPFTPEDPRSMPSRRVPTSGIARGVDEALDPLGVDFIPGVAITLQIRAHDAAVGELEVLRDGRGLGPRIEQHRHAGV